MNVKVVDFMYIESDKVECQGTWRKVQKYKNMGYNLTRSRNGYWLFTKPSDLLLTLESGNLTYRTYFRGEILAHYEREKLTKKLANTFIKDLTSGKIHIKEDNGDFYIE